MAPAAPPAPSPPTNAATNAATNPATSAATNRAPAPPRTAPPAPPSPAASSPTSSGPLNIVRGRTFRPQLVCIYGPGGIGKTSFACAAPNPIVLSVDDGVGRSLFPETPRVDVTTWSDLRAALASPALHEFSTIVIDSITRAEELAIAHMLATIRTEKGAVVTSIEGYGFGKGYQHLYETFLLLIQDCQQLHIRKGRSVVLIAHDCSATVANPCDADYSQNQPRLSSPNSGKASIRLRVREECDHLLLIAPDIAVTDGKAKGGHTRTLYTQPGAWAMTKSRLPDNSEVTDQPGQMAELWRRILDLPAPF